MTEFVHLHNHGEYSLLDGLSKAEEIADTVSTNGQTAVALTDHGSLAGLLSFQKECTAKGVKSVNGLEAYFVDDYTNDGDDKGERSHLILLAKNQAGLENLFRINNAAWTDQYYYKPRVDFANLEQYGEGLIVLSGCMGSSLSKALRDEDETRASQLVEKFSKIFGEDYYIEIQPHNPPELNAALIEIGDAYGVPIVGTLDCHFPTKKDQPYEEVLLMIGQSGSLKPAEKRHAKENFDHSCETHDLIKKMDILYPDRRLKFKDLPLYLMNTEQVLGEFKKAGIVRQDIIENSATIAEKCNSEIKLGQSLLPSFTEKQKIKMDSNTYLTELAEFLMEQKGPKYQTQVYKDRLAEELEIITAKNFSDYFLVLWDIVTWARDNDIAMGPGRGSSAGCLLAYVLGIVKVDPVKWDLLFYRFMSPERTEMPDIDIDFEDRRRDEVKQYIRDKWGDEYVAGVSAYGTLKAKAAVKNVSSVFSIPFSEANAISPAFETLEQYKTFKKDKLVDYRQKYPDVIRVAERIEGLVSTSSAHAAGMVIANQPIDSIVPIETRKLVGSKERIKVAAFNKDEIAELGLVKLDALSLKAVTVIKDCINKIKEVHGIDVEAESTDLDNTDPEVYKMINDGFVVGIFQAEGGGYENLIKDMGIKDQNDLVASNALVRPGAFGTQGKKYIGRRDGTMVTKFDHEILEGILGKTYGTFIYEEQVMKISVELAGFSWAKADKLRKIISKKKDAKEFDAYRDDFVDGASKYISPAKARGLWADIEKASTYMFTIIHSTAYSWMTYQTAWLKLHYPTEFMWATLFNETDNDKFATYLFEAERLGIPILPPDINKSGKTFTLEGSAIRFGLENIAACGDAASSEIVDKRPFSSFDEFMEKTARAKVKAPLIENMEKVGCFESIGHETSFEKERYFGSILSYPIHMNDETPFDELFTPCGETEASNLEVSIVRGVIKTVKKTATYNKFEIEDKTGSVTAFASMEATVKKRDDVVALIVDNAILHVEDFNEVMTGTETVFSRFLHNAISGGPDEPYEWLYDHGLTRSIIKDSTTPILSFYLGMRTRKTKTGKDMGSAYYAIPGHGYFKFTFWENLLLKRNKDFKTPFSWHLIKIKSGGKWDDSIQDIIGVETYIASKGLSQ